MPDLNGTSKLNSAQNEQLWMGSFNEPGAGAGAGSAPLDSSRHPQGERQPRLPLLDSCLKSNPSWLF
jgi:hypothetical protein